MASEGNRLVFKPSPLAAPPKPLAASPAPIGASGSRDDVTLFIPGKLDSATAPFVAAASPREETSTPAAAAVTPEPSQSPLWIWLAAAIIMIVGLLLLGWRP